MKDKINVLNTSTLEENLYLFGQSTQISGQTGLIGYLRGDFDKSGNGFYTTWFDDRIYLKTDEFKSEFDTVINGLRSDKAYGGLLENLSSMQSYCHKHKLIPTSMRTLSDVILLTEIITFMYMHM